jgi:hypothetical protein
MTTFTIYGMTSSRDSKTLESFINAFVDKGKSEERVSQNQIHIFSILEPSDYWVEAQSLSSLTSFGIATTSVAFSFYLVPKNSLNINNIPIGFTFDSKIVLGFSIDYYRSDQQETFSDYLLQQLIQKYDCFLGMGIVESRVPLSEVEFREDMKEANFIYEK